MIVASKKVNLEIRQAKSDSMTIERMPHGLAKAALTQQYVVFLYDHQMKREAEP